MATRMDSPLSTSSRSPETPRIDYSDWDSSPGPRIGSRSVSSIPSSNPTGRIHSAARGSMLTPPAARNPLTREVRFLVPASAVTRSFSTGHTARLAAIPLDDPAAVDPSSPPPGASFVASVEAVDEFAHTYVYSPLRNGTANLLDVTDEQQGEFDRAFHAIKMECKTLLGTDDVTNFRVNFTRQLVYYTDATGEHAIPLERVRQSFQERGRVLQQNIAQQQTAGALPENLEGLNRDLREIAETYQLINHVDEVAVIRIGKGKLQRGRFDTLGKGVVNGETSFKRPNYAPADLPKSMGATTNQKALEKASLPSSGPSRPVAAATAMARMIAGEKMLQGIREALLEQKAELERRRDELDPADAATPAKQQELGQQIVLVERKLEQFPEGGPDQLDGYALSCALAAYPVDDADNQQAVNDAAERLHARLNQDVNGPEGWREKEQPGGWRSWVPERVPLLKNLRRGSLAPSPYPAQVAGLMFSGLDVAEARDGYWSYCHEHSIPMNSSGVEDAIMRMAVRTDRNNIEIAVYQLLRDVQDADLREEIADRLIQKMQAEADRIQHYVALHANANLTGTIDQACVDNFRQLAGV